MSSRSAALWWGVAAVVVTALVVIPLAADAGGDDGPAGFDGYIRSGTCEVPSGDFAVDLESDDGDHDVRPYVAVGHDGSKETLGYYGAPGVPGFSVAAVYSDQRFALVLEDADSHQPVACGDILRPDADRFGEAGVAVTQLLPIASSEVEGVAVIERGKLERELDVTPARVRIIVSTDPVSVPTEPAAGYEGYVQSGRCDAAADDLRVELESEDAYDVTPFRAILRGVADPVTVAYYGSPGAPGFGVAAAYTDQDFSVVIEDLSSDDPVACGDILTPDADEFEEAGQALVQLLPTGSDGVQGYAVLDRVAMQRELDVTPMVVRVVLFAAPATGE